MGDSGRSRRWRAALPDAVLGFGGGPIGNMHSPVDEADARDALDAAWEAGVRYFDTAPHYGLGLSERRMGAALAGRPRAEYVLSTKVGRLLRPRHGVGDDLADGFAVPATHERVWDFSGDGVRRSLEESLERLGLDRVDVVFLHDPDDHLDAAVRTGFPALARMREEGVVAAVGAGMSSASGLLHLVRETDLDVVMLAGRYTLLDSSGADELLPSCLAAGVEVLAAAPFNSGLLARADDDAATYDYGPAPAEPRARARRIAAVCREHGVAPVHAALRFPLTSPAVTGVVAGLRDRSEVEAAVGSFDEPVPDALWADLAEQGLIRPA